MEGWIYFGLQVPPASWFFIQGTMSLSATSVPMVMLHIKTFPQAQHLVGCWSLISPWTVQGVRCQSLLRHVLYSELKESNPNATTSPFLAAFYVCPPKPKRKGCCKQLAMFIPRKFCLPLVDSVWLKGIDIARINPSYCQNQAYRWWPHKKTKNTSSNNTTPKWKLVTES